MKIYLLGKPLIKSWEFKDNDELYDERKRRDSLGVHLERDWSITTWNSFRKLGARGDGTRFNDRFCVYVELGAYTKDDSHFFRIGLPTPSRVIDISGYDSGLQTPITSVFSVVSELESAEIDCLVDFGAGCETENWNYASPRIREKLYPSGVVSYASLREPFLEMQRYKGGSRVVV